MKLGDLIQVKPCERNPRAEFIMGSCKCFFCKTKSNGVGLVSIIASSNSFHVMFDEGWQTFRASDELSGRVKVIRPRVHR
ncbi:hypothetical protein OAA09_01230 [bacterium]|nr:hypothetical protein [bacterium]